ncbi:MAG TPA: NAD-dependent epimerase/dehydratase family protein [Bacteroidales bacterium]|nr:NAD-dependent epimerase/dehydratase family protein [Bacteroidales bacterium]
MNRQSKIALVFGATGLTGHHLTQQLLTNKNYREIICINRHAMGGKHERLTEIIDDYSNLQSLNLKPPIDDVYCCIGTTIKKAGSKESFKKVDLDLSLAITRLAADKKAGKLLVVSSIGAKAKSGNFYLRTKGEMEQQVLQIDGPLKTIVRPSMLLGERNEKRTAETLGQWLMKTISFLMIGKLRKYRPIPAADVARAMIAIANSEPTAQIIFESDDLQEISNGE